MRSRLRLHLPLLGIPLCLAAGWFELGRALAGRTVAWVYAFEWPLFALMGGYIWWRLRVADRAPDTGDEDERGRAGAGERPAQPVAPADPGLAAWQSYLSRLQAADRPGGPR